MQCGLAYCLGKEVRNVIAIVTRLLPEPGAASRERDRDLVWSSLNMCRVSLVARRQSWAAPSTMPSSS